MGVTQGSSAEARRRLRVAIAARVSTKDRDQDPETQLLPLREHLAGLEGVELVGEFVDKASVEDLRGRREWRRLLERARAEGKHVGRPRRSTPVTEHRQWPRVREALDAGLLARAEAARRLRVRRSTLDQVLAEEAGSA